MRFGVLGPLTVWTDAGAVVPIPGAKVRALLANLLVTPGQPVPADRLIDDIWADDPPGNPAGTLAAKASQLRRALEDAEPGGRDLVVSPPPGYRLATSDDDAQRFRALVATAREATGTAERVHALTEALGLWRGPAFADFRDAPFAQPVIAQLEEQRLVAVEELAEARLSLGELRQLDADNANLRAALDGFVRTGAADRALRLVNALAWYWQLRGRLTEARRWLDAALALGGSARHRARALAWSVGFAFQQGEFGDGAAQRAAVFALYDTVDDPAGRARAELFLGASALESGDVPELEALVGKALAAFEELGDRWGVASAHVTLAKAAHNRVDLGALERHARTAARMFAELDDRWGRLQAAEWLGGLAELTGELTSATDIHTEALGLAQELELWGQACTHLCWLAWVAMQHTDFARARALGEQAQRIAAEHGYGPGRLFASVVLAFTARRDGRGAAAEEILRELLALPSAAGEETPLFLPMLQIELGYILERRGDPRTAFDLYSSAFDGAQRIGAPRDTAFALAAFASALAELGEPEIAARLLGAAAAVRGANGIPLLPAELPDIDRPAKSARTALGDRAFEEHHAAGAQSTPCEARDRAASAVLGILAT
ncbi:BTAD domain-containing putative transcriptional regulator [Nocardia asteroides]